MLIRLANVVYWTCCGLAALSLGLGIAYSDHEGFVIGAVVAAVLYGIGRGVRYVVAGK